jgi:acyl-CoA synthetase (AMP-forming)/AMP-acid ligase II
MYITPLLRRAARHNADRTAIVYGDRTLTFAQAWDRGIRLANGLHAAGLRPGDRVGVLEGNTIGAVDMFLGCAIGGFTRVPLYARNKRRSHAQMLNNVAATTFVVEDAFLADAVDISDDVDTLERVIVRDAAYEAWLQDQSAEDPMVAGRPDDLFVIRHTGGTTGDPLAAPMTHEMWFRTGRDYYYPLRTPRRNDVLLHVGPISHGSGYFFLPMWMAGGAQVLAIDLAPAAVIEVMAKQRITHMFMPPSLLSFVLKEPSLADADMSALTCMTLGAQPASQDTLRSAHEVFGDVIYELYGGTETSVVAAMGPSEWFSAVDGSQPLRAAGRAYPWAEIEIRDEEGNVLPDGEPGRIWSRNDGQIAGYMNAPTQTAERFVDGWVHIGDVGKLDENGYLYLLDRAGDMINSGGYNIYPSEIEDVITQLPDVVEAAAFAVPHEKWGETPLAVVVTLPGSTLTAQEVIDHVTGELGSYRKPTRVVLQEDPLPRSPVGKMMRRSLRDPYWEGIDRRISGA